jgi:hypothetical protein
MATMSHSGMIATRHAARVWRRTLRLVADPVKEV